MAGNVPYLIPAEETRVELVVVNSRFVATACPVADVAAVKAALARLRAEMPEAHHHVYAYRLGFGSSVIEGMSDDGEPSGTAGPPALAVVRGSDLGDVLVVIARYFGGTKLGTGGLVRAYTDAAKAALAATPRLLKIPRATVGVEFAYSFYERVKALALAHDGQLDDETFAGDVTLIVTLPEAGLAAFQAQVTELTAGRAQFVTFE